MIYLPFDTKIIMIENGNFFRNLYIVAGQHSNFGYISHRIYLSLYIANFTYNYLSGQLDFIIHIRG